MKCAEVKSSKYQTRKSPAFHAGDCKGTRKRGKDGMYVSQADKRGIYKWVKVQTKKHKGKYYDIHNNGARPFRVYIDGSTVHIYKSTLQNDNYDKLVRTIKTKKIYIGGEKRERGNSIVLHLSGNKYMHIGCEIYEFHMEDEVDSYFSIIGNSDVPYPVLLGTEYVYFMLDYRYVPRTAFSASMTKKDWKDAYQRYYGWIHPMTGEKSDGQDRDGLEAQSKKMKGFHLITKTN
uniref:Uncharacterized protein n=1 Tax=viral metagenome TaxID=1070528 RepID=A0A6C0KVT2_9ZZZZ